MEQNILKKVTENKNLFIPHLFTNRQINIMNKYLNHQILNNTEKTYFYSTIKRKIDALRILKEESHITGQDMIPKRINKSKQIIKEINKERAFISGSFLFKKEFEDIDIYIISKKRKSYHKGNKHFIFITENDLKKPLFYSALKYSVANFSIDVKPEIKREGVDEILFTYQWVINQILDKEDQKELRNLVFQYYLQVEDSVLDSYSLYLNSESIKKLSTKEKIEKINQITKETILKAYSKKYIYNVISAFSKNIKKMKEEYDTNNIPIFLDFAKDVKNECRRIKI